VSFKVILSKFKLLASCGWTLKDTARKARRRFVLEVLLEVLSIESSLTICALEKELLKRREK